MDKTRTKNNIKFLLFIFIISIVVFFGYYIIKGEKNPIFSFLNGISEKEEAKDNYNGVYTYYDELNGSKFIFSGCSVSRIANHLLIMDSDYYLYRSSCMGTYAKESGKTKDLDIKYDENKKAYYVLYKDKTYSKDYATMNIVPNNDIASKLNRVELSTYQIFMKETEFEGNYYDIDKANISGVSSDMRISFIRDEYDNKFTMYLKEPKTNRILYSFHMNDFDNLPNMYAYGKSVVIVERGVNKNNPSRLGYTFKVVTLDGLVYKLDDMFPITINDVMLNSNNSIFITFDTSKRVFRMLVGFDDKMCVDTYDEKEKNDIVYYEFTIDYNYSISGFDKPKFVKIGYKSEGCRYVNSIMGG